MRPRHFFQRILVITGHIFRMGEGGSLVPFLFTRCATRGGGGGGGGAVITYFPEIHYFKYYYLKAHLHKSS